MPKPKKPLGINPLDLRDDSRPNAPRLKAWWIPQVPMKAFEVYVSSFAQAKVLLGALAQYDLFQLDNNIKPDFGNVGGLCIWDESLEPDEEGEKWTDWENDLGEGIDELTLAECVRLDQQELVRG